MKRITVIMPDEVYNKVIELAKKEKRKKSPMAAMLIEDGLKLADKK
jgi:predicted transcriptional regulator